MINKPEPATNMPRASLLEELWRKDGDEFVGKDRWSLITHHYLPLSNGGGTLAALVSTLLLVGFGAAAAAASEAAALQAATAAVEAKYSNLAAGLIAAGAGTQTPSLHSPDTHAHTFTQPSPARVHARSRTHY